MAYQIHYTDREVITKRRFEIKPMLKWIAGCCVVIALTWLLQLERVQNCFIPGDPDVTKAAFSSFTQELKNGEGFYDAAAVFCRQVLEAGSFEQN